MPESVNLCPLCKNQTSQLLDRGEFAGKVVENRICSHCGFVFQSPRMTAAENRSFYESEYRQMYQGGAGPNTKDLAVQAQRARSLLDFSAKYLANVTRMLDIGCSAGMLLQAFHQTYHCQPVGVEPGIAYREYARDSGLRVYPSLEEMQQAGEGKFDLICMAHVLEHIPDPIDYLETLRETYLASDGWLLLEVPNLYIHDSFEVAHLSSFSPHTFRQIAQRSGFKVLHLQKHGRPRSSILPYYLTMLCCSDPDGQNINVNPEHGVRFKRKSGLLFRKGVSRLFPRLAWRSFQEEEGQKGSGK